MPLSYEIGKHIEKVPAWGWVAGAGVFLWWATRDRERHGAQVTPRSDEDIQTGPDTDVPMYNPMGAHHPGMPYELGGMCCPPHPGGRVKQYPQPAAGVMGMLWYPDPQDDDGCAGDTYGRRARHG